MNYLALCQRTVRESGTMSGSVLPSTVVTQTGRLLDFVEWVAAAWTDIQNMQTDWLWMQGEFTGNLLLGAARYTAASFNLSRWRSWITADDALALYDSAIGVGDEGPLNLMSWDNWRKTYGRGTQTAGRPIDYTISPAGELCFGPTPSISTYVVRGTYRKNAQLLAANTDIPEMPEEHHLLIVWQALLYVNEFDEAAANVPQRRRQDAMRALEAAQLPEMLIGGGALA